MSVFPSLILSLDHHQKQGQPAMLKNINKTASALFVSSMILCSTQSAQAYDGSTSTGLDEIVDIINRDERLNKRVPADEIAAAAYSADMMNGIIVEAIQQTGVANDGNISKADTRELNDYIFLNHHDNWVLLHGDDEDGEETGFHLVQADGAREKLFGKNAINRVADGIYHLGFETHKRNRLMNEDGANNAGFLKVATWLNGLLEEDLTGSLLKNDKIEEVVGDTGTGLDQIIDIIYDDAGLKNRISTGDMREGAFAANAMNHMIIDSIRATGIAVEGEFTKANMATLNQYIVDNYEQEWAVQHGDDEDGEETGFHLVQSDGAKTRLFDKNAINKVADGVYHLGFQGTDKRLLNEDGNNNVLLKKLAIWMNLLLADQLADGSLNQ